MIKKSYILSIVFLLACIFLINGETSKSKGVFMNLSVEEFYKKIIDTSGDKNYVLIDVRTSAEYKESHIDKSINIDFYATNFKDQIKKLDKSKKYLLYCHSGNRSGQTLDLMKKADFLEVYNLKGGIGSWSSKSYPLVK